jgi:putative iron-only hydrogenase system regulator
MPKESAAASAFFTKRAAHATIKLFRNKAFFILEEYLMEKRLGVIGIVVENLGAVNDLNQLLHEYAQLIVGRMGIPYRKRGVSVISLIVDGSNDDISALTGKIGRLRDVSVKSALAKA